MADGDYFFKTLFEPEILFLLTEAKARYL